MQQQEQPQVQLLDSLRVASVAHSAQPLFASPAAIARLPEAAARRLQVCPLAEVQGYLVLACAAVPGPRAQQELRLAAGQPIRFVPVDPARLQEALDLHYGSRLGWEGLPQGREPDAAALVDQILTQGVRLGASDIHILPLQDALSVRYRVDGVLRPAPLLPARAGPGILARIKVIAGLDIVNRRRPQDGSMAGPGGTSVRVSTMATLYGEKAVLRLLSNPTAPGLEDLGLLPPQQALWRQAIGLPHGLLLVAGPTGSGKTSTLYASLEELDRITRNVTSLEEPVERPVDGVSQIPLGGQGGINWAEALRAVLRQDPDVIAVGEIRDGPTASAAVQAALTGHLVLATVHAATAPGALYRLLDLGVAPWMVAGAVTHVLAQRLVRRLCKRCLQHVAPEASGRAYWQAWVREPLPSRLAHARGCPACHGTGYAGRMAVAEILPLTDDLRRMITGGAPPPVLSSRLPREGWLPMQRAGCLAARAGLTTVTEVMHHVG